MSSTPNPADRQYKYQPGKMFNISGPSAVGWQVVSSQIIPQQWVPFDGTSTLNACKAKCTAIGSECKGFYGATVPGAPTDREPQQTCFGAFIVSDSPMPAPRHPPKMEWTAPFEGTNTIGYGAGVYSVVAPPSSSEESVKFPSFPQKTASGFSAAHTFSH